MSLFSRSFFSVVLLAVFFLHTAVFDHHYDERIFGGISQAITHGEEKKWFADFLSASVSPFTLVPALFFIFIFFAPRTFFVYDPIRQALRRGTVHSKVYA